MDGNQRYIFDIIGIITLSLMSYKFHRRLYLQMKNGEIITNEIPYFENMFEYLNDQIAIHLRSFFALVSCQYDKNETNGIIFISMIIHLSSFYNTVLNIIYLYKDYNHNKLFFQKINMICISICVAFDIFYLHEHEWKENSVSLFDRWYNDVYGFGHETILSFDAYGISCITHFEHLLYMSVQYLCLKNK